MKKEVQTSLMHHWRFRKGERFAHKASQALSERIVPAFHVGRFTRFFSDRCVLLLGDYRLVSSPEISEAVDSLIGWWHSLPQATTGSLASVSNCIANYLAALSTESNPDPTLVGLLGDKGPQLIQF